MGVWAIHYGKIQQVNVTVTRPSLIFCTWGILYTLDLRPWKVLGLRDWRINSTSPKIQARLGTLYTSSSQFGGHESFWEYDGSSGAYRQNTSILPVVLGGPQILLKKEKPTVHIVSFCQFSWLNYQGFLEASFSIQVTVVSILYKLFKLERNTICSLMTVIGS